MLNAPPEKQQQHAHDCFSYYAWKNRNAILYIFYSFLKHLICNVYAGIISGLKRLAAVCSLLATNKKQLRIDDISDLALMLPPLLVPRRITCAGR